MSTPTSETLNGGSTFTPTQKSGADESVKGQLAELAKPRMTGGNTTSGMTCNSQIPAPVAKPVDSKTITGSYPGDHRAQPGDVAKESLDKAADNGGPRNSVGQFKGSKSENQPPFISTPTDLDSDAGN